MTSHPRTDARGFRLRGGENTRIEAFTDAAFAFALTLLVIGGNHAPANIDELLEALSGVPAYAASFALLCVFWHAHYVWYRRYGVEDGRSVLLSLALVFLVLIYVYPLHMLFSTALSWSTSDAPRPDPIVRDAHDVTLMFVIYGIAYAALSAIVLLLYAHAWSLRERLGLDAVERLVTRNGLLRWSYNVGIGLSSAALALAIPDGAPVIAHALPGVAYLLLFVFGLASRRHLRRQLAASKAA
jgi:uncharacterized membrane protein